MPPLKMKKKKEIIDSFILLEFHVNSSKGPQWQVNALFTSFLSPLTPGIGSVAKLDPKERTCAMASEAGFGFQCHHFVAFRELFLELSKPPFFL